MPLKSDVCTCAYKCRVFPIVMFCCSVLCYYPLMWHKENIIKLVDAYKMHSVLGKTCVCVHVCIL